MLVRRSPASISRWLRRGLVSVTVAPFGVWTGITLADERARSAPPYDIGLEVLAARPTPWRARPAIGLFDVRGRAAITVHAAGLRTGPQWVVWEPRQGVVATPELPRLRLTTLLSAAGASGRVREEALAEVLRSGHGTPVDLLVTVLGLLGLPGKELLVRGDSPGATDVEPSARGVLAFDRLVAEDASHRAESERLADGGRR